MNAEPETIARVMMQNDPAGPSDAAVHRPAVSVVAPCFNEEACLSDFMVRVTAVVGDDYEIVLVDDGSKDRTWTLITGFAAADARVMGVRLSGNFGHQRALSAGLAHCTGARILIIDADLQDPPELFADMMALMDGGADVVYGQRRRRDGETRFKSLSAALFYRLLNRLIDVDIPMDTGDFRLISRRILDVLAAMPEESRFVRGMVSWIGMKQVPLLYDRAARLGGETEYSLANMIALAVDAITGFSVVPLRLASYAGILTGIASVLLLFYTLGSWLLGLTVTGWTSLGSFVLALGSVQLLVLGVIGEYLGRLFMASKQRPLFVVQEVIRRSTNHGS
jgi:polyisoprenyl-phosphate glycosyltransferase